MTEAAPVLGVLAGLVGIADTIPYVGDTLRGTTRPHRGTWLIWSVLAIVVCLSQRADGASWSLRLRSGERRDRDPHPSPARRPRAQPNVNA